MKFFCCSTTVFYTRWLGTGILLLLITTQIGWAAGTSAGSTISNSATFTYSIGVVPQPSITSTASTFLVDAKVNQTVVGGNTTNVAAGSTAQATAFSVTNNSNSAMDFSLAVTSAIIGDTFDPTACSTFVESGTTAGYQAAQDIATFIDELSADATSTVYAVCDIPAALVNGNTGFVGVSATAQGNFNTAGYVATAAVLGGALTQTVGVDTANVDVVFADIAGTEDIARDAKHSAHNTYSIAIPSLAISKTIASVLDPNGSAVLMPGAVMTYQIAVALTGSGSITNLVVTDPLPADTTYVLSSISVTCVSGTYSGGGACGTGGPITPQPAAPKTDTNLDADFTDFNGTTPNTITVSLGNVAAPANVVITFRATIN